jgi:protein-tyrosine phosphatase
MRVLFVCLGNICRSPSAEAVMRGLVEERGLAGEVEIDSAGTGDWHIGKTSDPRAIQAASLRGIELTSRARQVTVDDFDAFDLIVAMDRSNREDLIALAGGDDSKVRLLREYGEDTEPDVPDPYFGGDHGFEEVLDILERNCGLLLDELETGETF